MASDPENMEEKGLGKKIVHIGSSIEKRKYPFIFCMIGVFFLLFWILTTLDIVPEPREVATAAETNGAVHIGTATNSNTATNTTSSIVDSGEPVRIIASTIGLDATVLNPKSRDTTSLDNALLSGAVRYPGSADLNQDGTMFIFGHSSNLPIVHNQNFKIFNNIKNLKEGDLIHVESKGVGNVYRVGKVSQAPADEIRVDLTGYGKRLVLSTCNSFGGKDSRYVVEATFVGSYPLSNNP